MVSQITASGSCPLPPPYFEGNSERAVRSETHNIGCTLYLRPPCERRSFGRHKGHTIGSGLIRHDSTPLILNPAPNDSKATPRITLRLKPQAPVCTTHIRSTGPCLPRGAHRFTARKKRNDLFLGFRKPRPNTFDRKARPGLSCKYKIFNGGFSRH